MAIEQKNRQSGLIRRFISWRPLEPHYERFEREVAALDDEKLLQKRSNYDHVDRNTAIITGLAITAYGLVAPHLSAEALLFSSSPSLLTTGLVGPVRGIVRKEERAILDEVIAGRGLQR